MPGVIILTGGASARMGADKAEQLWAGVRAVDRVAALAQAVGAAPIFTVGVADYGWAHIAEPTPLGGPVGGVLAGIERLRAEGNDRALILAVDAPTIRPADLEPLLTRPAGAAFEGLHLPVLLPLASVPNDAEAGWPLARLLERANVERVVANPDAYARLRGANTPDEREALLADID